MEKTIDLNYIWIESSKTCCTVTAERSTSLIKLKIPITYGKAQL